MSAHLAFCWFSVLPRSDLLLDKKHSLVKKAMAKRSMLRKKSFFVKFLVYLKLLGHMGVGGLVSTISATAFDLRRPTFN